jgi:preprotein translocase subunit SecE
MEWPGQPPGGEEIAIPQTAKRIGCTPAARFAHRFRMSKERTANTSFLREMLAFGAYKRSQGAVTRQVTFAALAILFAIGAWRMYQVWGSFPGWWQAALGDTGRYAVSSLLLLAGLWFSFRIVNYPKFADFLIAVEGEMNKVSWPSRGELIRSSLVVIVVIALLAAVLFFFDVFWQFIFGDRVLGILRSVNK